MFRVSGDVIKVDTRSGSKNGNDWTLHEISVLVNRESVVKVTIGSRSAVPVPKVDEKVDWWVNVRVRGNFIQVDAEKVVSVPTMSSVKA